jgi:hypothetical protein
MAYRPSRHERARGSETEIRVGFVGHSSLCIWGDLSFPDEAGHVLLKHPVIRLYFLASSQYRSLYHIVIEERLFPASCSCYFFRFKSAVVDKYGRNINFYLVLEMSNNALDL